LLGQEILKKILDYACLWK